MRRPRASTATYDAAVGEVVDGGRDGGRDVGVVQSVDRAVTILEVLARVGEAGVGDVARELEVHKSTAFRLLRTLAARGLVEQADDRGTYRIGLGLVRIAGTSAARTDLVQSTRVVGKQLATDTGETVNVAVLRDDAALYVDQIVGAAGLQAHNWVGLRIPLHATSDGKVLLAALPPSDVDRLVHRLEPYTERTLTRREELHRELAQTRRRGWATAVDELEEGLSAVAAPIHDVHGEVVASLSVSGSGYRLTPEALDEVAQQLVAAADEASRAMGWPGAL